LKEKLTFSHSETTLFHIHCLFHTKWTKWFISDTSTIEKRYMAWENGRYMIKKKLWKLLEQKGDICEIS